jgi:peptidyl-prolyl cis-trans isomerase SurA
MLSASHAYAERRIVDRVVGVVGDSAILLSELKGRAKPYLKQLEKQTGAARVAAEAEMYKELLNRLVDEELVRRAAAKIHVTVRPEEIDRGIASVAAAAKVSREEILKAAKEQGMNEEEYRAEIGRQILEGKMLQLRVRALPSITDKDIAAMRARVGAADDETLRERVMVERLEAERKRWMEEMRKDIYVDVRL